MLLLQGKHALKQSPGAGRENIAVLDVCSATGIALDRLVIFQGKNIHSTWFGDEALPNTFNGISQNSKNITINELNTLILFLSFYVIADMTNR